MTQLLSSGKFFKLRYDTIPVKRASTNVSFYTKNSKMPNFLVVTLLSQMSDIYSYLHIVHFVLSCSTESCNNFEFSGSFIGSRASDGHFSIT